MTTILITRPEKRYDPTEHTYKWGEEYVKLMKDYGVHVVDIVRDDVNYSNVTNALRRHRPEMYIHVGHGCPTSLQGQHECILTRRFGVDELVLMSNFKQIMTPLSMLTGCKNTCKMNTEICNPICTNDTNVGNLRGTIVMAIACYSAAQLGSCATKYGANAYYGFKDLMLFPVDDMRSQDIFKDIHKVFLEELLSGHSVGEAENVVSRYEDALISLHKKTKYISLPILWNKINRRVLGNKDATLYDR